MRPQGPPPGYRPPHAATGSHPYSPQQTHSPPQTSQSNQGPLQRPNTQPILRGPSAPPPGIRNVPAAGPRGPPPGVRPGSGPSGPPPGAQLQPRSTATAPAPTPTSSPPTTVPRPNFSAPPAPAYQQPLYNRAPEPAGTLPANGAYPAVSARPSAPPTSYSAPPSRPPPLGAPAPLLPPTAEMNQFSISRPPLVGQPVASSVPPMASGGPPPPSWHSNQARRVYPEAYSTNQPRPLVPPPPPIGVPTHLPGVRPPLAAPGAGVQAPQPMQPPGSRIDPNQIPRPQPPVTPALFETRVNGTANLPPSATTQFVVKDTGNCSPKFMRSTLNQIPCSGDLLNTSSMPFAIMVQPMALPDSTEEPIQVVDFRELGPVRCGRCKGYINPFMKFVDHGRRFICNLCGFTNETPHEYMCNLGPDGRRRDADERPELCKGSVEFVAPKEYMVRAPMPPVLFFLVDVSLNAVATGATASACDAIQKVLADIPSSTSTLVGFATFNSSIHFYSLNPRLQQPTMLVVPDVNDVYTPLPSDLVVKLSDVRERLEQLIAGIPAMFQSSRVAESAAVAALQASYLAIKDTGGKIIAFQSVLPSLGIGSLSSREVDGRSGASVPDKELVKLLQPADKALKNMAMEFADFQVSVDLFLTTKGFVDVASLAVFPRTTGGQLYMYHPFDVQYDSTKLYNDLRWNLMRPVGLEAVMKVRCSAGLSVDEYYGNFHRRLPAEIYLPSIDCDKSIMVTFRHDDKLADNTEVCFQAAILYTTSSGERRVRVHTLSLPTTTVLANLFRGADLDSQFTFLVKNATWEAWHQPLQAARDSAIVQSVNILHAYRKYCASATSSGQLILPEALKLLPLYTLALNKCTGLRKDARLDERCYWLSKAHFLSTALIVPLLYPRLFALHALLTADASSADEGLPPSLGLSSEKLEQDGVFLLENGEDAFLWLGRGVSADLVHDLFGVKSLEKVQSGPFVLQDFGNGASKKLNALMNTIRGQRCSYLRLQVVKRGDALESTFLHYLIEDRSQSGMSYVEFLVYVHRQIQNKMS